MTLVVRKMKNTRAEQKPGGIKKKKKECCVAFREEFKLVLETAD